MFVIVDFFEQSPLLLRLAFGEGFEIRIGPNMNVSGGEVGQAQALSLEMAFDGLDGFLSRQRAGNR